MPELQVSATGHYLVRNAISIGLNTIGIPEMLQPRY